MKNLSIVVPCYNEENRIKENISKFVRFAKNNNSELIFVNDGSKDNTLKVLKNTHKRYNFKIISYSKNKGKGFAIKEGIKKAKNKYILMCDVDLSTPLSEINKFKPYLKEYEIIIGSREEKSSNIILKQNPLKRIFGKLGKYSINFILRLNINDTQCGFKLFNRNIKHIIQKSKINRFGFDFEILYLAKKEGMNIKEIGIEWTNNRESKVKAKDYFITLFELIKVKLRN